MKKIKYVYVTHRFVQSLRIKRALTTRGHPKLYTPTEQVAKTCLGILNRSFEDKLKSVDIVVRRLRGCIGQLHMDWGRQIFKKGIRDQEQLPTAIPHLDTK